MTDEPKRPIRRALLSVSDKAGIAALATKLLGHGVEILATGHTHLLLIEAGLDVREVADYTAFPELMDGRLKTLHPLIHGGILGRRELDLPVMEHHGILPIDLVVVNLYPFEAVTLREDCTREAAIENIDIGGPAMVRSAAKNHADVLVVVDPADYPLIEEALAAGGSTPELRALLATKAFHVTARYDSNVARYLSGIEPLPERLTLAFDKLADLRYGENPHQRAALYADPTASGSGTVARARQLQGKELSYNNLMDTDAALECVKVFDEPACVIVKHANPCGVATAPDVVTAYEKAHATDPTSAYGGIVAFNRPLTGEVLSRIVDRQFVEVVIAPGAEREAVEIGRRRRNLRLLVTGAFEVPPAQRIELRRVGGGLLAQTPDEECLGEGTLQVVTARAPTNEEMADLLFAWRVAWFVKSNAIVYAKARQTIGVGAGQMSRVVAAKIAGLKAAEEGLSIAGSVMASDAFFPFRDGIDAAAAAGITAVIQPGGSVSDAEVIGAANEHGMAMVFTGLRHFRH